jgi:hypothetical protein
VTLTFRDDAALAAALLTDADILPADTLQSPLTAADLSALTPQERDQMAYWQPITVGALLFNFWD